MLWCCFQVYNIAFSIIHHPPGNMLDNCFVGRCVKCNVVSDTRNHSLFAGTSTLHDYCGGVLSFSSSSLCSYSWHGTTLCSYSWHGTNLDQKELEHSSMAELLTSLLCWWMILALIFQSSLRMLHRRNAAKRPLLILRCLKNQPCNVAYNTHAGHGLCSKYIQVTWFLLRCVYFGKKFSLKKSSRQIWFCCILEEYLWSIHA